MITRIVVRVVPQLLAAGVFWTAACVLSGCNTVKGAGEDIKAVGQAGEDLITGNKNEKKD
ncbi:MAG: entericidin A/B family lipoprotein [Phycisphaeraceae bacterium]|nr:entericidin A/B family lipoprotein [Phycisphaeraceae bacterium]